MSDWKLADNEVVLGMLVVTYKSRCSGPTQIAGVNSADFVRLEEEIARYSNAKTSKSFRVQRYTYGIGSRLQKNGACSLEPHKIQKIELKDRRLLEVKTKE